ncbi:hypothetical protein CCUS01_00556 [Colletotrichum cuscutae]|uniref:Uncharacterized protein n=1 Tax=Colletotrichum cuscutae TaxID=1209917 RepID=A0AAI9Y2Z9_9PEZI|nr:hypothetical protein CCUS01_00556 [Colletotrichum cuscutae]
MLALQKLNKVAVMTAAGAAAGTPATSTIAGSVDFGSPEIIHVSVEIPGRNALCILGGGQHEGHFQYIDVVVPAARAGPKPKRIQALPSKRAKSVSIDYATWPAHCAQYVIQARQQLVDIGNPTSPDNCEILHSSLAHR